MGGMMNVPWQLRKKTLEEEKKEMNCLLIFC